MDALPPGIDLSKTPLAKNPNGDPPNFVDPPSLATALTAAGIVLIAISSILIFIRLITNLKVVRTLFIEDCTYKTI